MTKEQTRKIIKANLGWLQWAFQLQEYTITFSVGRLDEKGDTWTKGIAVVNHKYRSVVIKIDPEHANDEEDLLETLRHEMIHGLLSSMSAFVSQAETEVPKKVKVLLGEWGDYAIEEATFRFEQMLTRLGLDTLNLVKLSKIQAKVAEGGEVRKLWRLLTPKKNTKGTS